MGRRRTIGYVENEWTCPNCGTRNKGSAKACENCGAPQPDDVNFELPSHQKIVKDEDSIRAAKAGADIHCPFCGTRNPATAKTCSQCGGDLTEGVARQAGRIMQAPPPPPKVIECVNCGTENPGENSICSNCGAALPRVQAAQPAKFRTSSSVGQPAPKKPTNWKLIGGIVGALALCCIVGVYLFLFPSSAVEATVTDVHWETSVAVQEIQPVRYTDQRGNPPSGAYNESCYTESEDVCEQRTVDKGNGYSEIVEDCHTETTQYCSYTVDE
ncbi:MAG TPA: zinc ribbon domain-containing protein, partial [Anaerolineales bacterium]|nr:zinc ribbon domain-containing protein [Anaerolineales bacterium]